MKLSKIVLVAAVVCAAVPSLADAQVRVGATAGYSFLESEHSLSGGSAWVRDEVTLGRSWLVGGTIDIQFGDRDFITFDGTFGPYRNDVERYCYMGYARQTCELRDAMVGSRTLAVNAQYIRTLGSGRWRPYLGAGGGIKQSWYREASWYGNGDTDELSGWGSYSLVASAGVEWQRTLPLRFEARTVYLTDSPLVPDTGRWEVQARATVFLARFGGFHK